MPIWSIEIKELEKLYDSLKGQLPDVEKELVQLIKSEDANVILLYSRRCLEVIITDLCECELKRPRKTEPLQGIIDKLHKEEKLPSHIISSMHGLNELSTYGTHPKDFDLEQVKPVLVNLDIIIKWYLKYKETGTDIKVKPSEEIKHEIKITGDLKKDITIPRKSLAGILGGSIGVIASIFAVLYFSNIIGGSKQTKELEKSIAVLPFFNESPDSSNIYICNGLMDDILTQLHKIGDLKVKSRTSAERYRILGKDIIRIGKELRVSYIIEGSVSKLGDNLQITVQLINAKNGNHLWAEPFNGKYTTEIFEFLNNVAKKVATSVNAVITPTEEKRIDARATNEIAAYDLAKRGHEMIRKWRYTRDTLTLRLANNLLDQSLKVDPEYIEALKTKSMLFSEVGSYDSASIYIEKIKAIDPGNIAIYGLKGLIYFYSGKPDSALKYFSQLEKLDPNDYWTNLALGQIYCFQKYDIIKSLPYFQKVIDLGGDSEAEINNSIAYVFILAGDYPKALKYFNNALLLTHECQIMVYVSSILSGQGKYGEAFDFLDSICSILPCRQQCDMMRFKIYTCRKDLEKAEKYYSMALANGYNQNENDELYIVFLYNETGRQKEALSILHNSVSRDEKSLKTEATSRITAILSTLRLAVAYAMMGDKKEALKYLEALEESLLIEYPYPVKSFPGFDNLRNDPEFKTIINKIENKKALIREQIKEMEERGEINL